MTMPLIPPVILRAETISMAYPYTGPVSTIILRAPEFNNSYRTSCTRIYTETRGGELVVFGDRLWAKDEELAWTFTDLSLVDKLLLEQFLIQSLGKEILLIDHLSLPWKAIITNPDAEFVQDSDACGGKFTISLTFNVDFI